MITINLNGRTLRPTALKIRTWSKMIKQAMAYGELEEVKENKEPTVHIPNDGKKYMINGELYNPQANSILEKLRKELEKMKTENTDTSDEYTQGVLNTCDYLLELLIPLEQPKEEPQPQEDIELLPKFDEYLSTTECIKLRVFSLEVQVELLTSTVNQLIKANKK